MSGKFVIFEDLFMKDMDMERYGKKYCPFLVKGPILIRFGCLARNFNPETYLPEQGIPIVTLYSYLSILVGKISTVFWQNLEYLLTDQG